MKTIYLNMKSPYGGVETVDEFSREENPTQTPKQFRQYVRDMIAEYRMAGMAVYQSSRPTRDWKNR